MTDQNLVGVGDEVLWPGQEREQAMFVVGLSPTGDGAVVVENTHGVLYRVDLRATVTPDGKPVTGFLEVRAEVIERESAYLYVGSELVWSFRYAKDAKSAAAAINRVLGARR